MNKERSSVVKVLMSVAKWTAILLASPFVLYVLWKLGTTVCTAFVPEYGAHCGKRTYVVDGRYVGEDWSEGFRSSPHSLGLRTGVEVVNSIRYRECSDLFVSESHVGKMFYTELRIEDIQSALDSWKIKSEEYEKSSPGQTSYAPATEPLETLFYVREIKPENNLIQYISWFPPVEQLRSRLILHYKGVLFLKVIRQINISLSVHKVGNVVVIYFGLSSAIQMC